MQSGFGGVSRRPIVNMIFYNAGRKIDQCNAVNVNITTTRTGELFASESNIKVGISIGANITFEEWKGTGNQNGPFNIGYELNGICRKVTATAINDSII